MLLNSAVGAAFLYRLRSMNARIGLPEVVELEVTLRTIDEGMDARDGIEKNLAKVRSLLGETEEIELPSEQTFRKAVEDRFSILGDFIERICISRRASRSYDGPLISVTERTTNLLVKNDVVETGNERRKKS